MATHSERARVVVLAALGALLVILGPGCGPPQVADANRRIVLALATATSARNPEWLEACARQIEQRQAEGALTDSERAAFDTILDLARRGHWEDARDQAYALRDAQRPSAEARAAVRARTLPEPRLPEPPLGRPGR